jgi:hypothetical protein
MTKRHKLRNSGEVAAHSLALHRYRLGQIHHSSLFIMSLVIQFPEVAQLVASLSPSSVNTKGETTPSGPTKPLV